jgi:hypothetical protein
MPYLDENGNLTSAAPQSGYGASYQWRSIRFSFDPDRISGAA